MNRTKLTRKRKMELRDEIVKEYINSKPYGTRIYGAEVGRLINVSGPTGKRHLDSMVRRGLITKLTDNPRSSSYAVNGDIKVIQEAKPMVQEDTTVENINTPEDVYGVTVTLQEAMQWSWLNKSDSLSLFLRDKLSV